MPDGGSAPLDFSVLGKERTAEVLAFADRVLAGEVRMACTTLRRVPRASTLIDKDDLRIEGQMAALEAALSFDPSRGASWKTWVRSRIQWRLRDHVRRAIANAKQEATMPHGRVGGPGEEIGSNDWRMTGNTSAAVLMDPVDEAAPSVEEKLGEAQAVAFVEKNAARILTPREQIIVHKRLSGVEGPDAELAAGFGVHRSRVTRDMASVIQKFSRAFAGRRGESSCA